MKFLSKLIRPLEYVTVSCVPSNMLGDAQKRKKVLFRTATHGFSVASATLLSQKTSCGRLTVNSNWNIPCHSQGIHGILSIFENKGQEVRLYGSGQDGQWT